MSMKKDQSQIPSTKDSQDTPMDQLPEDIREFHEWAGKVYDEMVENLNKNMTKDKK